ncbi:hypothetical protein LXA43DRAFT_1113824, partial [Ganoderma leucocontextum]
ASTQPAPFPTTTPLLEALKAENTGARGRVDEEGRKKKEGAGGAKEKVADSGAGSSKKGAKKAAAAAKAGAQSQTPGASKDTTKGTSTKQGGSKPPKPPRERTGATPASGTAPAASSSIPASAPTAASAATATSSTPRDSTAAPSRRSRPVLGLASRQFEAALSGAGVERKSRREREKEKEKEKGSGVSTSTATAATDAPPAPASKPKPKEEKRERALRRGGAPPTILQRDTPPKILARPPEAAQGSGEGSTLRLSHLLGMRLRVATLGRPEEGAVGVGAEEGEEGEVLRRRAGDGCSCE